MKRKMWYKIEDNTEIEKLEKAYKETDYYIR